MLKEDEIQALFGIIDKKSEEYTQLWVSLCEHETRSDDKAALNEQADFLEEYAGVHGLQITRHSYPAAGDSVILTLAGEQPPVALLGHMDTVHEKGAFGYPVVRIEDGKLYGPGVSDMKGGIITALLAMEAIRESGAEHPQIRLILNPDEESGANMGADARRELFEKGAEGCIAAFNCETGCAGHMTVGRKGIIRAAIDVKGIGAHSGNDYFAGASAIKEMAYKIIALEKHSKPDGLTFNCGVIRGGTVVNIVPTDCRVEVDIRYLTQDMYDEALQTLEEVTRHCDVPGTSASWTLLRDLNLPAMEATAENRALFDRIAAFAHDHGLEELTPIIRGGGSDSAFTVQMGIPTVCSMGATGKYIHTVKEEADIASLPVRAKILAGALLMVHDE